MFFIEQEGYLMLHIIYNHNVFSHDLPKSDT